MSASDALSFSVNHFFTLVEKDSFCFALDLKNKSFKGSINKKSVWDTLNPSQNYKKEEAFIKGGGYLYIGQEQDIANGGFEATNSLAGYLSDLLFYERLLSSEEMSEFTKCGSDQMLSKDGLLFDFSDVNQDFELSNVDLLLDDSPNYQCARDPSFKVLFPGERTFFEGKHVCQAMGGQLVVPKSKVENRDLFKFTNENKEKCIHSNTAITWLGVVANETEKYFEHYKTKEKLVYENIRKDFTLNWPIEKCVMFFGSDNDLLRWQGLWNPVECLATTCVTCYFYNPHRLNLRGLCAKSLFDRKYMIQANNKTESFKGIFYTFIERILPSEEIQQDKSYWRMYRPDKPQLSAILKLNEEHSYPVGRHFWDVTGDTCGSTVVDLMMTACDKHQFTCNDGSCISSEQRCNLEVDCADNSDELDCLPLILPPKYSQFISPPRSSKSNSLFVFFFLDIFSIRNFNLEGFKYTAEIVFLLSWKDPRLQFKNLKHSEQMNVIEMNGKGKPWVPYYEFLGDQNSTSKIVELGYFLHIQRKSKPLPDNDENVSKGKLTDFNLLFKFHNN